MYRTDRTRELDSNADGVRRTEDPTAFYGGSNQIVVQSADRVVVGNASESHASSPPSRCRDCAGPGGYSFVRVAQL